MGDFYAWYMKHKLYRVAMNNVGDPYKQSPYSLNSHEYLAGAVPTITTSRSALGPLKFWWKINSTSLEDFQALARNSLSNAEYLLKSLKAAGVRVWKNPYSNTLFFERAPEDVMKKYDLAPDEGAPFGKIAHFVVMPHVDRKLLDGFVLEMGGGRSLPIKKIKDEYRIGGGNHGIGIRLPRERLRRGAGSARDWLAVAQQRALICWNHVNLTEMTRRVQTSLEERVNSSCTTVSKSYLL